MATQIPAHSTHRKPAFTAQSVQFVRASQKKEDTAQAAVDAPKTAEKPADETIVIDDEEEVVVDQEVQEEVNEGGDSSISVETVAVDDKMGNNYFFFTSITIVSSAGFSAVLGDNTLPLTSQPC
ncbi:hypothetical protein PRK78_005234 [Emydomyces testavorans]|uniref:Uncharacterized protein n=1 Tax=Emydomyces testavorans TaxID=2070801 RepID=A0AAF0DJ55_9EURO|nr:hypothetical protein PRK78_005234 [Emydomyces testavorans]